MDKEGKIDYDNMTEEDYRLITVTGWQGKVARHFKGGLYLILDVHVEHTETNERMILYKALYGDCKVYVRPARMFIEKCTSEQFKKYGQEHRFQLVDLADRR